MVILKNLAAIIESQATIEKMVVLNSQVAIKKQVVHIAILKNLAALIKKVNWG